MTDKGQHLPEELFSWLESRTYNALNEEEKQLVSNYLTIDDYGELHQIINGLKNGSHLPLGNRKEAMLHNLLQTFDQIHPPKPEGKVRIFFSTPALFWKAATVALLLCSAWLLFIVIQKNQIERPTIIAQTDTVYLMKEIVSPAVRRIDTVFITQKIMEKAIDIVVHQKKSPTLETSGQIPYEMGTVLEPLSIVSLNEIDSRANSQKNNSMKGDSMLKQFTIVRL